MSDLKESKKKDDGLIGKQVEESWTEIYILYWNSNALILK